MTRSLSLPTELTSRVGSPATFSFETKRAGSVHAMLNLPPGIYRLSAQVDAADFDWDRLYISMTQFKNHGQRTGPWDYEFEKARPLMPAFWVSVNGQRLGLWVLQRLSIKEIEQRRMSGAFCFEVTQDGPVELELTPYNDFAIKFVSFRMDAECDDVPRPVQLTRPDQEASLAAFQAQHQVWNDWQAKLQTTHRAYGPVMDKAIAFAKEHSASAELLPLLTFAWKARHDEPARAAVLAAVKKLVEQPHWGNPAEDGYGHDMDMGVAAIIEALAIVYHWLGDDLGGLRAPLREKLNLQMQRFYTAMLLCAEYWGGSLAQDHGRRSVSRFGVAAFNLLDVLPEAKHWLAFVTQRMERAFAALPTDGGIPFSSYHKVHLYMDDMVSYRDALRHATGRDLFDSEVFPKVISFVSSRLHEPTLTVLCASPRGDRKDFYAGWGFFNAIAEKFGDGRAARLTELLLRTYETRPMIQRPAVTLLAALDHHASAVTAIAKLDPPPFVHLPDSGFVHYRDDQRDVAVSIRCTPPGSRHSYATLKCSCDRILDAPLAGHFTVAVKDQTLLLTAEGGYRMRASLGNVLLVDGKGAVGDIDYPMGLSNVIYRGERIVEARFDSATGTGFVSMDIGPAYPAEMGLVSYQRELLIRPAGLICRDRVVATKEHAYSWHFQTYARRKIQALAAGQYQISDGSARLTLQGSCRECLLVAEVAPTEVVWAYANENEDQDFVHVEFKTNQRLQNMIAEFAIEWDAARQ